MRSGLLHVSLAAALVLWPHRAAAQVAVSDDGAAGLVTPGNASDSVDASAVGDAGPVDASMAPRACEGGLCDTQVGTTCRVASGAPGRASSAPLTLFRTLGVLAVAAGMARRRRRRGSLDVPGPDRQTPGSAGAPCPTDRALSGSLVPAKPRAPDARK